MKNFNKIISEELFYQRQKSEQLGKHDGEKGYPHSESQYLPEAFKVIHNGHDKILGKAILEYKPSLDAGMKKITIAEQKIINQENKQHQTYQHIGLGIQTGLGMGASTRADLNKELQEIPNKIISLNNDIKSHQDKSESKIITPILSKKTGLIIKVAFILVEGVLISDSVMDTLPLSIYSSVGLTLLCLILFIGIAQWNGRFFRGAIKINNKRQSYFLTGLTVIFNTLILFALYGLSTIRESALLESILMSGMGKPINAEIFGWVTKGLLIAIFLLDSLVAYLSSPNEYGQAIVDYEKQIKKYKKRREEIRKEVDTSEEKSRKVARKAAKQEAKKAAYEEDKKTEYAIECLKSIDGYVKEREEAIYYYNLIEKAQREDFIIYRNQNELYRNGTPMTHYSIEEMMERYPLVNPFEEYPCFSELRIKLLQYSKKKKRSFLSWLQRKAAICFIPFVLLLSSCSTDQIKFNLVCVIDTTEQDTSAYRIDATYLFQHAVGESYNKAAITGHYGTVHFVLLNGGTGVEYLTSIELKNPSKFYNNQRFITRQGLQNFMQELDRTSKIVKKRIVGAGQSRIYTSFCDYLNDLARKREPTTTMSILLYSDLIEHSDLLNGYGDLEEMKKHEQQIKESFIAQCQIPSLENIEITIQYRLPNKKSIGQRDMAILDKRHHFFVKIYRSILEDAGAIVRIVS